MAVGQGITINQGTIPRGEPEISFAVLEKRLPELFAEMRTDLKKHPFAREFVLFPKGAHYNGQNKPMLFYYFEEHQNLRDKIRILEHYNLVKHIEHKHYIDHFVFLEPFVDYLTNN